MNSEALRDVANIVLIVGLVVAACGTFGVNYFRGRVEKERGEKAKMKEAQSDARAANLQGDISDLVVGKDELLRQNSELSVLVNSLREQVGVKDSTIQHLQDEISAVKKYSYVAGLTFNDVVRSEERRV